MTSPISERTLKAIAGLPATGEGVLGILITAGPTCEDIDAVRYITNRSTGRMGIAAAEAAVDAGHVPLLVLGPTSAAVPDGVQCLRVRSAEEMCHAVTAGLSWCDALIMTAAVADYRPAARSAGKLQKTGGDLMLRLERTPDILATAALHQARHGTFIIGYALDADVDIERGWQKLRDKQLDAIVVNTVASFASDSIRAVILRADGSEEDLGVLPKAELAGRIVRMIEQRPAV